MSGYRSKPRSLNNAYMLVYVRDVDWDKVMAPTGKDEVSEHVRKQLEQQLDAKDAKRRAKMQAHRFVTFKVITDAVIKKHVRILQLACALCYSIEPFTWSCSVRRFRNLLMDCAVEHLSRSMVFRFGTNVVTWGVS